MHRRLWNVKTMLMVGPTPGLVLDIAAVGIRIEQPMTTKTTKSMLGARSASDASAKSVRSVTKTRTAQSKTSQAKSIGHAQSPERTTALGAAIVTKTTSTAPLVPIETEAKTDTVAVIVPNHQPMTMPRRSTPDVRARSTTTIKILGVVANTPGVKRITNTKRRRRIAPLDLPVTSVARAMRRATSVRNVRDPSSSRLRMNLDLRSRAPNRRAPRWTRWPPRLLHIVTVTSAAPARSRRSSKPPPLSLIHMPKSALAHSKTVKRGRRSDDSRHKRTCVRVWAREAGIMKRMGTPFPLARKAIGLEAHRISITPIRQRKDAERGRWCTNMKAKSKVAKRREIERDGDEIHQRPWMTGGH
jgi:hypothetical protein